jgi:hypothetical protein
MPILAIKFRITIEKSFGIIQKLLQPTGNMTALLDAGHERGVFSGLDRESDFRKRGATSPGWLLRIF